MMKTSGDKVLVILVLIIHAVTPQIHYPHFPSFYTFHQYPILNGYFASGRGGSGFFHRLEN